MDAVSLPLYHPARSRWLKLVAVFALLCLLALLASAVGGFDGGQAVPADGELLAPFRWDRIHPGMG